MDSVLTIQITSPMAVAETRIFDSDNQTNACYSSTKKFVYVTVTTTNECY